MIQASSQLSVARRRQLGIGIGVGAVVLAVAIVVWLRSGGEESAPDRGAVSVTVSQVTAMTLTETVRGIGTLRAPAQGEITPEVAGRVRKIHFTEGSFVKAGDVLVELKNEKLQSQLAARQAAVRSARVRFNNIQRTFERQQKLVQQGVVSEDEFERVRADRDSAEVELERVQAEQALVAEQLQDTVIRAPFDGAITQKLVDVGAFVPAGTALARLYQTNPLEIAFSVSERYLGQMRRGQPVAVGVAAYPDENFEGTVTYVSPVIAEATRTLSVKADIPNQEGRLSPGGFATAVVTVGERPDRPVVPEESLVGTRTGYMVFVVEEGAAKSRSVNTGLRRQGIVEITDGLQVGERVVRQGHMRLDDGTQVEVIGESPVDPVTEETTPASPPGSP